MPSVQSPDPNDIDSPRQQIEPQLRTARLAGLLQDLSDADFEIVVGFCRFRSVQAGTRVIQEGTDADCLLLVVDGRLDVRRSDGRGGEINIGTVGIGWEAIIAWTSDSSSAVGATDSRTNIRALARTSSARWADSKSSGVRRFWASRRLYSSGSNLPLV